MAFKIIVGGRLKQMLLFTCCFFYLINGVVAQAAMKPTPAPDFSLPSENGEIIKLSDYKRKTLLLNFWASWCAPCRAENKKLVKLYPTLDSSVVEILNVSVDTDEKKWKQAIAKDKMAWRQALDYPDMKRSVAAKWGASALPASFLITPEGVIIAADAAMLLINDPKGFRKLVQSLAAVKQ